MKQKTAMMELIEWLNLNGMKPDVGVPAIKEKANQLLEKEKEQMELAYCSDFVGTGIDYYNQTYLEESKQ